MTGFLIAMISGALMSIQGVFNTDVTKSSSIWVAAGFVQLTALAMCVVMWFVTGRPDVMALFSVDRKYALLGGVIGAFITYTVVRSMSSLGTAKASLTIVVTQVAAAYLIDAFRTVRKRKVGFLMGKVHRACNCHCGACGVQYGGTGCMNGEVGLML